MCVRTPKPASKVTVVAAHRLSSCSSTSKYTSNKHATAQSLKHGEDSWPCKICEHGLAWALVSGVSVTAQLHYNSFDSRWSMKMKTYCFCFPHIPWIAHLAKFFFFFFCSMLSFVWEGWQIVLANPGNLAALYYPPGTPSCSVIYCLRTNCHTSDNCWLSELKLFNICLFICNGNAISIKQ